MYYPGPQVEATVYPFSRMSVRTDRLAQVGFVVITVGNRRRPSEPFEMVS